MSALLLDTHAFVWAVGLPGSAQLHGRAAAAGVGGDIVITVRGEPVAQLVPLRAARRRRLPRADLASRLAVAQADSGLRDDLERRAGERSSQRSR